jgi:hypothetical protein
VPQRHGTAGVTTVHRGVAACVMQTGGAFPPGYPILSACTGEGRVTYGRGGSQPPWDEQEPSPPQGYGQQHPLQEQPWRPQHYDPGAHRQRLGAPQPPYPPQGQPGQQPGYGQQDQPGQQQWPPFQQEHPQQPGYGQPPWPPQQPRRKSWPARHKALTGLIALGSLIVIGGIANAASSSSPKPAADTAAATPAASAPPAPTSAAAAPDCATQVKDWGNGNGSQQLTALGSDVSTFGTTMKTLAADIEAQGIAPASDTAAVQSAAATVQTDAQAVEANPGPACLPGLRSNLAASARDYQVAAIDATNGLNQMSAGNMNTATADIESADTKMGNGYAKIAAATSAVNSLSASQGG